MTTNDPWQATCIPCDDLEWVCENHPQRPWGGMCCEYHTIAAPAHTGLCAYGACGCGAGQPCPACNPAGRPLKPTDIGKAP